MRFINLAFLMVLAASARAQLSLDNFVFDNNSFGDTLIESDGGSFSFGNWLNVVNAHPGNPGLLTGASFDTGIANIGLGTQPVYTIGYANGIVNRPGDDLGIVVARFSEDTIQFAVSEDGFTFSGVQSFGPESAVDTGVQYTYFYGGGGPFSAELFVQPIDLSDFGVGLGNSITAAQVTGTSQLDLIRVAGFAAVPEPGTLLAMAVGATALIRRRRSAK